MARVCRVADSSSVPSNAAREENEEVKLSGLLHRDDYTKGGIPLVEKIRFFALQLSLSVSLVRKTSAPYPLLSISPLFGPAQKEPKPLPFPSSPLQGCKKKIMRNIVVTSFLIKDAHKCCETKCDETRIAIKILIEIVNFACSSKSLRIWHERLSNSNWLRVLDAIDVILNGIVEVKAHVKERGLEDVDLISIVKHKSIIPFRIRHTRASGDRIGDEVGRKLSIGGVEEGGEGVLTSFLYESSPYSSLIIPWRLVAAGDEFKIKPRLAPSKLPQLLIEASSRLEVAMFLKLCSPVHSYELNVAWVNIESFSFAVPNMVRNPREREFGREREDLVRGSSCGVHEGCSKQGSESSSPLVVFHRVGVLWERIVDKKIRGSLPASEGSKRTLGSLPHRVVERRFLYRLLRLAVGAKGETLWFSAIPGGEAPGSGRRYDESKELEDEESREAKDRRVSHSKSLASVLGLESGKLHIIHFHTEIFQSTKGPYFRILLFLPYPACDSQLQLLPVASGKEECHTPVNYEPIKAVSNLGMAIANTSRIALPYKLPTSSPNLKAVTELSRIILITHKAQEGHIHGKGGIMATATQMFSGNVKKFRHRALKADGGGMDDRPDQDPMVPSSQAIVVPGFDAIGEHTGSGHNHNIMVPFGGDHLVQRAPSHNRLSCSAIWRPKLPADCRALLVALCIWIVVHQRIFCFHRSLLELAFTAFFIHLAVVLVLTIHPLLLQARFAFNSLSFDCPNKVQVLSSVHPKFRQPPGVSPV
ncbi:hypothetical protein IEQ34_008192 [Dendrobium chrysotoxum]|uniref:Uncharacterized protein n=1 Tax=Dendrobium chrysotoxum TaxID=161865 RepID=A0AAV7H7X4_DENCH|nr:hypothetical protein IEQ34_008192 [Dendrobium chrysotoxum]